MQNEQFFFFFNWDATSWWVSRFSQKDFYQHLLLTKQKQVIETHQTYQLSASTNSSKIHRLLSLATYWCKKDKSSSCEEMEITQTGIIPYLHDKDEVQALGVHKLDEMPLLLPFAQDPHSLCH